LWIIYSIEKHYLVRCGGTGIKKKKFNFSIKKKKSINNPKKSFFIYFFFFIFPSRLDNNNNKKGLIIEFFLNLLYYKAIDLFDLFSLKGSKKKIEIKIKMADFRQILKQYGSFIELGALLLAFISVLIPFISISHKVIEDNFFNETDIYAVGEMIQKDKVSNVNLSYVKFKSGKWVLFFVIVSALFVSLNTFAKNVVENLKNNNKNYAKTIDAVVELVPLIFIAISFLLTVISGFTLPSKYRSLTVGYYLLLLSLIVILAVRVYYLYKIRKLNEDIKVKEISKNIKDFAKNLNKPVENDEDKAKQTEQTTTDAVVVEVQDQQTVEANDAAVVGTNKPIEQVADQDIAQINSTNYHK